MSPEQLIQWLLDAKLAKTTYDKFLKEQMLDITPLGIDINTILNKLKETSKESESTNIYAAERLESEEQ